MMFRGYFNPEHVQPLKKRVFDERKKIDFRRGSRVIIHTYIPLKQ